MHMHNVKVTTSDSGDIILTQCEFDCDDKVYQHPEQLRLIARRVAGLKESTVDQVADLERKIGVLASGISSFVCDTSIRTEIIDHCPSSFEFIERLDGLLNLALEYDGGRLLPDDMDRCGNKPICDDFSHKPKDTAAHKGVNTTTSDSASHGGISEVQLDLIDQA